MKRESHPVDDLFREALKDVKVTPSPAMRDRFLEEAVQGGGKSWKNLWNSTNIFILAGLVTLSVILYFLFTREAGNTPGHAGVPEQKTESSFTITNAAPNNQTTLNNNPVVTSSVNSTKNDHEPLTRTDQGLPKQNLSHSTRIKNSPTLVNTTEPQTLQAIPERTDLNAQGLSKPESSVKLPGEKEVVLNTPASEKNGNQESQDNPSQNNITQSQKKEADPDTKSVNQPFPPEKSVSTDQKRNRWDFSPYLMYQLDWSFTDSENPFTHTLGIQGKLNYERLSLTFGSGISAINGYQRYQVKFIDYLGNYNRLDSITFAWDQNQYYLIPKYHMTETDVWDSTINLDSYRIEKQYRILRVPVLLGYDLLKKGRFNLGVQSGLELTAFLGSKTTADYHYDAGRGKVISIDPDKEQNTRTNFFWMFNLSAEYTITRRFSVTLEPSTRYLLNPESKPDNTSDPKLNPFIRASFRVKF